MTVTAPTTRDDMCFWLYTSGSTGKPKGAVHMHADLRLTDDLYAAPILGITENDVCLFGGQAVLRLWARQCADLSDVGGRHHRAACRAADAGRWSPTLLQPAPGHACSSACRPSTRRFLASAAAPERGELQLARLRLRRRSAAGRCRRGAGASATASTFSTALGSTEMLHIFLSNRPGDVQIRHHRQAGAGLRHPPRRRRRRRRSSPRRDRRIAGARADQRHRCTGTTASSRARLSSANGRAPATNTFEDADGYYVYCGRRDDMLKVCGIYVSPFEVEGALHTPSGRAGSRRGAAGRTSDRLIKPKAFVVLKAPDKAERRLGRGAAGALPAEARARTNIRAGSSSAPNCRRPRPAKSSASSCAPRRMGSNIAANRDEMRNEAGGDARDQSSQRSPD